MLGSINKCQSSNGLGATESTLPAHYLTPMTKAQIDAYIEKEKKLGRYSKLAVDCQQKWSGEAIPCFLGMVEIERANLYYVNKIINYDRLNEVYREVYKMWEDIPIIPSIKQQLRDIGTFIVGAVAGFIAAGPIGFFTGGAAATQKIIADAKAKAAMKASTTLEPLVQKAVVGEQQRMDLEANTEWAALMPWLIGTAIAGVALVYFGDDLKKMVKA